jgi:hypothetical protein
LREERETKRKRKLVREQGRREWFSWLSEIFEEVKLLGEVIENGSIEGLKKHVLGLIV